MFLAGSPFFISPSEINSLSLEDLNMWLKLGEKRIKMEKKELK